MKFVVDPTELPRALTYAEAGDVIELMPGIYPGRRLLVPMDYDPKGRSLEGL